jgi:hypothetical protein
LANAIAASVLLPAVLYRFPEESDLMKKLAL